LAVFDRKDVHPSLPETLTDRGLIRYEFLAPTAGQEVIDLDYQVLSLEDIHLGHPGQFRPSHPVHKALSALKPDDKLTMRLMPGNGIGLFDHAGICVARLSRKAETEWANRISDAREIRVLAMLCRSAEQDTEEIRRERYQVPEWEVPLVEVVTTPKTRSF
jgi:hypothetical protein